MESHARLGIIKRSEAKTGSPKFCSLYRMYIILFYLVPDFSSIKTLSRYTKKKIALGCDRKFMKVIKSIAQTPCAGCDLENDKLVKCLIDQFHLHFN